MRDLIKMRISESAALKHALLENDALLGVMERLAHEICKSISLGGKLVLCGNGGSACDALHFAGEIVGRFQRERNPWPAVCLNADVATLTAIANDYGYDESFSRQASAHCEKKDIFIGISTSGNSENVFRAALAAKNAGSKTAAFLGKDGGKICKAVDFPIVVPCDTTARVQECHITLIHILCEFLESKLCQN